MLNRYSLGLFGQNVILPDLDELSIAEPLLKIWPSDKPFPELPNSIRDDFDP